MYFQGTDQTGNKLFLKEKPKTIISLVPSQTELLAYFDLDKEVIGVTKFCIYPEKWFKNKTRIGGTKTLHLDKIKTISPDIIFANKEENDKGSIIELQKYFQVYVSDIRSFEDALKMISDIGRITKNIQKASSLCDQLRYERSKFNSEFTNRKEVVYLIWNDPKMIAANKTFINEMINIAGFSNVFDHLERYPEITDEDLIKAEPEFVFLSSEPYPFKEKHIDRFKDLLPKANVILVDGTYFSWYGSRLLGSFDYFRSLAI